MGRTKLEKIFPTYNGYIANSNDALIVLQAVLNGVLKPVSRRPNESERSELIKSGNVFVFIEETSGIKRWTDGTSWSPSRILARFLIYRELSKNSSSNSATNLKQKDSKNPRDSKNSISKTQLSEIVNSNGNGDKNKNNNNNNNVDNNSNNEINKLNSRTITAHALAGGDAIVNNITKKRSRSKSNGSISSDISNFSSIPSPKSSITNITTSTTNTSISSSSSSTLDDNIYRSDGLIKKSMSLCLFPNTQFKKTIHLVSYYRANDVLNNLLNNPTNDQLLKNVELSFELLESLRNTSLGNMLSTRGSSESFESHGFCENDGFDENVLINFSKQYNEKYSITSKRRQLNSLYQYQPQYPTQHHQYPFQNQYQPQYQPQYHLPPHQLTHSQSDHEINYHSQFANYNHHHHSYDNSAIPIKYEDNKIPLIPSMSYPLPSYNNKIPNNNLSNFNINFSHNPQSYNNNIPSYIPNYDNNLNSNMNNNNVSNNGSNSEILNNETIFNNNNNTNAATTAVTSDVTATTTTATATTDNKNDSIINDGDKNEVTTGSTNLSKIHSIFSQGNNSPIIYGYNNNTNSNSSKINLQSTTPIPKQLSPPNNFHERVSSSNATQFGYPPTTQYSPVSYQQPLFDYQTIPTQLPLQTNSPNANNPLIQLVRTPFNNNSRSNTPNAIQNLNPNQNQRIYSLQYVTSTTPISYNNNMINTNNNNNNNIININKLDTINKSKTPVSVKIENDDTPDKNNNNTGNAGSANNLNEENISVKIESESNVVNGNEAYRSVATYV